MREFSSVLEENVKIIDEILQVEESFDIIKKGSGQDFDPLLVEIFMDIRDKVEAIYHEIYEEA